MVGTLIVDIGDDKSIEEANKDLLQDDILEAPPTTQRSAITNGDQLWTSPVPYVLDKGLEINAKGLILKAFDQFRLKSCIDFKPRDSEEYYIHVQKLNGCFSYIGNVISNGQNISIGCYCDSISTIEHEFLHTLGFYHEQSRSDRDDYVTIVNENIQEGRQHHFYKKSAETTTTTQGVPYDYWSVLHSGKGYFSNGNGSTIITKDPKFQDVIGQRLEMSPKYALELNLLYKCRGPMSDHTNLPSGSGEQGEDAGYFMHVSTASGEEGDSAWLETHRMSLNREHHEQCLQFYYFHSGPTKYWKLHHVSLNATKHFQVEFEVRKGAGSSTGGFSIDDINLSEIECPHVTMQLDDFERNWNASDYGASKYSTRYYSSGGYAYALAIELYDTHCGLFVQLVSGENDDRLEWPCTERQVTFKMLDQNANILLQMSKQFSITSDLSTSSNGSYVWDNPRLDGLPYVDDNGETIFAGTMNGRSTFSDKDELKTREFLKGGSVIFTFSFQDITALINGSALPIPQVGQVNITYPPKELKEDPCVILLLF
ncbi:hypothetical protein KUCAC02_014647 [Chaenocephalus aceratus]|uniref:Uncharacterized protein n=1 Tax=Chaenocephalus aceratus TaxID=36190 RepID=A0ACB9WFB8_CHAAC|nr:hypothetical protein KUCAC02_014647 [Chaenocephalus aceratus]